MLDKLILCSIIFILSSCQQPVKQVNNNQQAEIAKVDTLSYKMVNFKRISPYFQMSENNVDTTFFEVDYPNFENDQINSLIKKSLLNDGELNLEEASESFLLGYDQFVEENDNDISKAAWFRQSKLNVIVNTPKILTYSNFTYEFTGGAHGNYYTLFTNVDPENNEVISLDNIIPEDKRTKLLEITEKHFRQIENIADTSTYDNNYFFDNQKFKLADNFALLKDSLLFYYNIYEIKAYSEGPTELKIPYSEIKDLFNEKGLKYIQSITN